MELSTDQYRALFTQHAPLSIDRVDSPWMVVPDEAAFNQKAFMLIEYDLQELSREAQNKQRPSSRGVLVLGEAGAGKTHLLMRLAKNLARQAPLLFISRPTNEEAIAQHIWECVVESLKKPAPPSEGRSGSQLDCLLKDAFTAILSEALSRDIVSNRDSDQKRRWLKSLKTKTLLDLVGDSDSRQATVQSMKRMVLNYISICMPQVDSLIADVLFSYCTAADSNNKRLLLNWLTCNEIAEAQLRRYGIPRSPINDDGSQNQATIQQAREVHALRCLRAIGELSVGHTPLILAFDQLEGFRNSERLTNNWGNVLRELFTSAPNYLVVTCVFPDMWESWFSQKLDASAAHRIAQNQVRLEQFKPEHAELLLASRFRTLFTEHRLPHALFPFTATDVKALYQNASSARVFLQSARARLKEWILFGNDPEELATAIPQTSLTEVTTEKTASVFDDHLNQRKRDHFNEYSSLNPSEQALFGKLREVAECLIDCDREANPVELDAGGRVLPFHQHMSSSVDTTQLVLAVCNANAHSFSARVNNLRQACESQAPSARIIVIRDARLDNYTPTMRTAIEALRAAGHEFVEVNQEEHSYLMGLHDCLVAVEEGELGVPGSIIFGIEHFRPYLKRLAESPSSPLAIFRESYSIATPDEELILVGQP